MEIAGPGRMVGAKLNVQPMRTILFLLNDLKQGGAETQALYLAEGLRAKGYSVQVISFGAEGGMALKRYRALDIPVVFTGFREKLLLNRFRGILSFFLYAKYLYRLIRMTRAIKPDYIIPFTYPPNIIVADLRHFTKAKICWNQRDEGRMFAGSKRERSALSKADYLVSNSEEGKDFIAQFTNKKIQLIHNGVRLTQPSPMNEENIPAGNIKKVVMVANLHHYKDHLTLLKAWDILQKNTGNLNATLILAGRFGTTTETIQRFIDYRKLKSVTLAGPVEDIPVLLSESHLAVFSSVKEGLPNGILEAMAAGLPVVATRIKGAEEALGKDYPFLCDSGNAHQMAYYIEELLHNSSLAREWGGINRNRIAEQFGVSKMVDAYEQLIIS